MVLAGAVNIKDLPVYQKLIARRTAAFHHSYSRIIVFIHILLSPWHPVHPPLSGP